MLRLVMVGVAFLVLYGGEELAAEGRKQWGGYADRVRKDKKASGAKKAAVTATGFAGWFGATAARGVARAAKDDWSTARKWLSAGARADRADARLERRKERVDLAQRAKTRKAETDQVRRDRKAVRQGATPVGKHAATTSPTTQAATSGGATNGSPRPTTTRPDLLNSAVTIKPPAATKAGTTTKGGTTTMSAPTGEAPAYSAMIAQMRQFAAQGLALAKHTTNLTQAAEMTRASGRTGNVDPATEQAIAKITEACVQATEACKAVNVAALNAASVLRAQQGALREAHAAQPHAATESFLKG